MAFGDCVLPHENAYVEVIVTLLFLCTDTIFFSFQIIEDAIERYGIGSLCICFNGGKDCTALLHLVHAVIQKKYPDEDVSLQSLYIKGENPFPEMELFIKETTERYTLICINSLVEPLFLSLCLDQDEFLRISSAY